MIDLKCSLDTKIMNYLFVYLIKYSSYNNLQNLFSHPKQNRRTLTFLQPSDQPKNNLTCPAAGLQVPKMSSSLYIGILRLYTKISRHSHSLLPPLSSVKYIFIPPRRFHFHSAANPRPSGPHEQRPHRKAIQPRHRIPGC